MHRRAAMVSLGAAFAALAPPGQGARAGPAGPITLELGGPASPAGRPPRGATLFLNALGPDGQQALARALDALVAALERRRNPLFVPIDDGDLQQATRALSAMTGPGLAAAAALAAGRWQSAEGDLVVRGVPRCGRGARCLTVGAGGATDPVERRALFLAWPVGHAALLGTAAPDQAARLAGALRASAPGESPIALVLTAADLHSLHRSEALAALLRTAARARALLPDARSPLVDALDRIVRAPAAGDEVPWLRLRAGAILVVPRLGALATPAAFVAAVRARLGGAAVEWLAAPAEM